MKRQVEWTSSPQSLSRVVQSQLTSARQGRIGLLALAWPHRLSWPARRWAALAASLYSWWCLPWSVVSYAIANVIANGCTLPKELKLLYEHYLTWTSQNQMDRIHKIHKILILLILSIVGAFDSLQFLRYLTINPIFITVDPGFYNDRPPFL